MLHATSRPSTTRTRTLTPPAASGTAAYKRLLDEIRRKGDFYTVPRKLDRSVGILAANLLMHLANVGQANADSSGWIMATENFLHDGIAMSPERQERLLEKLEQKGWLAVSIRAGRRHIRIDPARVRKELCL